MGHLDQVSTHATERAVENRLINMLIAEQQGGHWYLGMALQVNTTQL